MTEIELEAALRSAHAASLSTAPPTAAERYMLALAAAEGSSIAARRLVDLLERHGAHVVDLFLEGVPVPKGRPRIGRTRAGKPMAFTPEETRTYERRLRSAASAEAMRRRLIEPVLGPLALGLVAVFPRTRESDPGDAHAVRPDADNLLKTVDALNGVVWGDDAQVCLASVFKRRALEGEPPCLRVRVERFAGGLS